MANFNGFTYGQIVQHIVNYIGNEDTVFQNYIKELIVMSELRYYKMHDWSFLRKTGLSLTTVTGQAEYDLLPANIGYFMSVGDVETIRAEADGVVLKKVDLNQIRRFDVENDDGSATDSPLYWAAAGDSKIRIWPPTVKSIVLKIDGKITPVLEDPTSVSFDITYPQIPLRYQEAFIEYVKALALDRENDDRAMAKKQEALLLIRQDIQADMQGLSEVENPRIKSLNEARYDGVGATLDVPGFRPGD